MYFSSTDDSIELSRIKSDIEFLRNCFTESLRSLGENQVADGIEGKIDFFDNPEKLTKAF